MLQRRRLPALAGIATGIGALLGVATFVFAPFYLIDPHPSTRTLITSPVSQPPDMSFFYLLTHQLGHVNPLGMALPTATVTLSTLLLAMATLPAAWRHTHRPTWSSLGIVWVASLLVAAIVLTAYAGAGSLTQALLTPSYHFFALCFLPSALLAVGAAAACLLVSAEAAHSSPRPA
jgi:hypothetical protein